MNFAVVSNVGIKRVDCIRRKKLSKNFAEKNCDGAENVALYCEDLPSLFHRLEYTTFHKTEDLLRTMQYLVRDLGTCFSFLNKNICHRYLL